MFNAFVMQGYRFGYKLHFPQFIVILFCMGI